MTGKITFRNAEPRDADVFVDVFKQAGHGLAEYFWRQGMAEGQALDDYARERLAKRISDAPVGDFLLVEASGSILGGMNHYDIGPEPVTISDIEGPAMATLLELEQHALNTRFINAVAVFPEARGKGVGGRLMEQAEKRAGHSGSSLVVFDSNPEAQRFYERRGYKVTERRAFAPDGWDNDCTEVRLMVRAPD